MTYFNDIIPKCHQLLEEHEDQLLNWFKNKQDNIENELYNGFCINQIKFCCPKDKFGSKCETCPTNFGSICSGHGKCDVNISSSKYL